MRPLMYIVFALGALVNSKNENWNCIADKKQIITAENINKLENCNHVQGKIHITNKSFLGMHPDNLNILKSIKTINGSIQIEAVDPRFINLSFFKNLERIDSGNNHHRDVCLLIRGTSLQTIHLPKLKQISCRIIIHNNKDLCYSDQWFYNGIMIINYDNKLMSYIQGNKENALCCCSKQCSGKTCWGPESNHCKNDTNGTLKPRICEELNETTESEKTTERSLSKVLESIDNKLNRILAKVDKETCNSTWQYLHENECRSCNTECKDGCTGPGAINCKFCKNVRDGENCNAKCPEGKFNMGGVCESCGNYNNLTNKECPRQTSSKTVLILSITAVTVLIIIFLFIGLCFFYCQRSSSICRKIGNVEKYEMQPLSGKLPDSSMAQLTIIKESEIRKLQILGSGAFGKVYEAIWQPEGTSNKISVAVKVLHQNSSVDSIKDFLDEAVVMASMDHSNIVHLIAICVTTEVMILTKLMPLGCLLNYVRINKQHISPKSLLTWITQIVKGMVYLEQRHLVHRDLAARNVLLETVDCIKISDFGLSKFVGTADFSSSNTKFPIKWLALECLEEKLFTHKSDVWAFGVTSWELLTFGDRPFDQVKSRELVKQLKLGSKLRQPPISSADVYATLLRCWLLKPELRPDFNELEITFRKMSYEPSKYLTSHGNAHFKKLNHIPQESRLSSDSTIRNSATHPLKNNYLYSPIATHSNNQINSNRSYLRNDSKGQQIQTIKLIQLRPEITIYSEQEDYLIPTTQQTSDSNDSGYDTIVHV